MGEVTVSDILQVKEKKVITVEVKVILLLAEEIERAIEVSIKIEKHRGAGPL